MASVLGIILTDLGRYLVFGYLDPQGYLKPQSIGIVTLLGALGFWMRPDYAGTLRIKQRPIYSEVCLTIPVPLLYRVLSIPASRTDYSASEGS